MNVNKYSASGGTHNSGMDVISVVIWNVTPSMRLDGTNARAIHRTICRRVGGGV